MQADGVGGLASSLSSDGLVLTASHVITDETGQYFSTIALTLSDGSMEFAKPATPMTADSVGQDFALLKVEGKTNLPFLSLGSVHDVEPGADATIIGYPSSAITLAGKNVSEKFCLSASFAARDLDTQTVIGENTTAKGIVTSSRDVKVDIVYFQGPSVKGISGSPIISRDSGGVVGIVTIKLTGIGKSLIDLKQQTGTGVGRDMLVNGLEPGLAVNQILTLLDDQLANGLGAATGIDDPKEAMNQVRRKMKRHNP